MAVRLGPGAVILPKDIMRIHLDFAYRIDDGHRGPRYELSIPHGVLEAAQPSVFQYR